MTRSVSVLIEEIFIGEISGDCTLTAQYDDSGVSSYLVDRTSFRNGGDEQVAISGRQVSHLRSIIDQVLEGMDLDDLNSEYSVSADHISAVMAG